MITTFQNHFAQATKDDVVIFYFAGHGVTQAANPVFLETTLNGVLECITCYDSTLDGHNMIADKELRWLINGLSERTGCHILVINDSCHSGDSTRSIGDDNEQARMITDERGTPIDVPMRPWKEFIFSSEITERAVERNDLNAILPQGKHIQLAACSSEELAQEDLIVRRGRFSMYLLDLLENSGGKLTYYDLRSLIFRRMSTLKKRQTPQFYAHNDTLFQPFLGGAAQTEVQANVNFNNEKNEWQMDMGSVYGIPQGAAVFVNLPNKNNQTEAATVQQVFPNHSVLIFDIEDKETDKKPEEKRMNRAETYKCSVGKFMQKTLTVACADKSAIAAWDKYRQTNELLLQNASIKPVEVSEKPDYVFYTEGSLIFIADPKYPKRPLAKMIDFKETAAAFTALVAQLGYISRWHFVKAQKTEPAADVLFDNLAITFEQEGRREDLKKTDKITCQVTQIEPSYSDPESKFVWTDRVTIRIRNTQVNPTKKLYVTGIFMSELFEIDCETINENSIATPLDSGKDFFVYGGNKPSFRISFYKNILIDKWDKFNNFLKIYVSEEPFVITQFKQLGLEYPRKDVTIKSGEDATGNRGGDRDDSFQEPKPAPLQWAVRTIELEFDTTTIV